MKRLDFTSAFAALAFAFGCAGCGARETVTRVVNGRATPGDYVPPEAYAAYLNGAIAESSGRLDEAVAAYEVAAAIGPRDPEPWTRLGLARCTRASADAAADDAIAKALSIDDGYAPAWEARARCAALRGPAAAREAAESARRALESDPRASDALTTLVRGEDHGGAAVRDRLLAMTLSQPTDAAAWRALATWGELHADAALEARALGAASKLGGDAAGAVDAAIRRLVGQGALVEARTLSHAEARAGRTNAPRLAIDDAILAGDRDEVLRLCAHTHVTRAVAAARAVLLGDAVLARGLASAVAKADPRAGDARMVLAAAADLAGDHTGEANALRDARAAGAIALEPWLVHQRVLVRRGSVEAARAMAPLLDTRAGLADEDPLITSAVVALAAQGALDPRFLGPNASIELAERRGENVDDAVAARADARHRLLARARSAPNDAATLDLARHLAPFRERDPLIAVAFGRLALAGAPGIARVDDVLARLDPSDPLVAAATFDLALHANDPRRIPLARARLAAVARTPAEMARLH